MAGRRRKLDINTKTTALLYGDFKIVRNARIGDIVTLSDGHEYEIVDNVIRTTKKKGRVYG